MVYHTHGIAEFNNGLELELNLPAAPEEACAVLNILGEALRNKEISLENGCEENTLFSMPLRFVKVVAIDGEGEDILRVIVPDRNGKFPEDEGVDTTFAMQLLPGEVE